MHVIMFDMCVCNVWIVNRNICSIEEREERKIRIRKTNFVRAL